MATLSLRDMLGYVSLSALVNTNVPDLPRRLPKGFYTGTPEKVEGNQFRYHTFTHARTTATLGQYYAPSTPVQLRSIGERDGKLFSTTENIKFEAWTLEALRNFDNYELQEKGKRLVAFQIGEFRKRFKHIRDIVALMVVAKGIVYRDDTGNILPTSSGNTSSSTFGITASTNQGTIGAISGVTGSWASPTTNIMLQLDTMRIKAQQAHGYIPEIILYGKNIPTYLMENDMIQPYLARNMERRADLLEEGYVSPTHDLFGYTWYPMGDAGYVDSAGTYQLMVDPNAVVLCPKPSDQWWGWAEGSYMVPSSINIMADTDAWLSSLTKVYGPFAYSKLTDDPPVAKCLMGDNFFCYPKIPDVIYQLTVA